MNNVAYFLFPERYVTAVNLRQCAREMQLHGIWATGRFVT